MHYERLTDIRKRRYKRYSCEKCKVCTSKENEEEIAIKRLKQFLSPEMVDAYKQLRCLVVKMETDLSPLNAYLMRRHIKQQIKGCSIDANV